MQAVEKVLEVEADMLEDLENRVRETLSFKRLLYQVPFNWKTPRFETGGNRESSEILVQRSINLSQVQEFKAEGFPSNTSNIPNPHHGAAGRAWCQKCCRRHFENCSQERGCYNCGRIGHMKRNWTMLQRQ